MTDPDLPKDLDRPPGPGRRRAPSAIPPRWLLAVGVAGVASVLGLTLVLRDAAPVCAAPPPVAAPVLAAGPAALAAPPVAGRLNQGKATFYDLAGGIGNCSYPTPPSNKRYVALGPSEYASAAACGGYLDVTGPKGSVRVLVVDQCPECAPGHIDLSAEAFREIADPVQGIVPVSYRALVDPALPGPLTFRIKEGASQYWFSVLVGSHGNPLRSVEVRPGTSGAWRTATRQSYNYWEIGSGAGPGPYSIRVTDTNGNRAVATGIRMAPGQVQATDVRMYGGGSATTAPRAASSASPSATPSRSASPSPSVSPSASPSPSPSASPSTSPTDMPTAPPADPPADGAAGGGGQPHPVACTR
ncbi:expansin EXLX1 family cellulose-binding protein [Micromonospora sp. NPDC000207]|uniref:expansin EXLX1 family cellulose-binding protein n=1 Tax=Micromonospora sp. NPDC000207 TaxID=3154246 RepID=UPI00332D3388